MIRNDFMNPGTSAMPATIMIASAWPTRPASSAIHGSATHTDSANQPMLTVSAMTNFRRTATYRDAFEVRTSPGATTRSYVASATGLMPSRASAAGASDAGSGCDSKGGASLRAVAARRSFEESLCMVTPALQGPCRPENAGQVADYSLAPHPLLP